MPVPINILLYSHNSTFFSFLNFSAASTFQSNKQMFLLLKIFCNVTPALQEKISLRMNIFRGQCVARFFGRQPQRRSFRKAAYESKQAVKKGAEARRRAPVERDPEV